MVVRILRSGRSVGPSLDYNEQKYMRGVASLLETHLIPSQSAWAIRSIFEQYERNPRISSNQRQLAFHMTVGPGERDGIRQEQIPALIKEVMEHLGYGTQPWVVYRHNDIDREHYHVVSIRVDKNGRNIPHGMEGVKLNRFLSSLETKYSFTLGSPDIPEVILTRGRDFSRIYCSKGVKKDQMATIWNEVLKYDIRSFTDLETILSAYGVQMHRNAVKEFLPELGGTGYTIAVRSSRPDGPRMWYSMERHFGIQADADVMRLINEGPRRRPEDAQRLRCACVLSYCLEKSLSEEHFLCMVGQCGMSASLQRSSAGSLTGLSLVDRTAHLLFHESDLGSAGRLEQIEVKTRDNWKKDDTKGAPLTGQDIELINDLLARSLANHQKKKKANSLTK